MDDEDGLENGADLGDYDDYVSGDDFEEGDADPPSDDSEDDPASEDEDEDAPLSDAESVDDAPTLAARKDRRGRPPQPDEILVVPREQRITAPVLTAYELARVLTICSERIARTNDVFLPPGVARASQNPVDLARQELQCRMCPLIIQRVRSHPNKYNSQKIIEEWSVNELLLVGDIRPGLG